MMFNVYSDILCIFLVFLSNRFRFELSYVVYVFIKIKIFLKKFRFKMLDGYCNY